MYIHRTFIVVSPEAEFWDVIGTRVFLLAFHGHLYQQILLSLPPPPSQQKWFETGYNVNIVYVNLKAVNSQDYAQKPQRNCTFMNSASGLLFPVAHSFLLQFFSLSFLFPFFRLSSQCSLLSLLPLTVNYISLLSHVPFPVIFSLPFPLKFPVLSVFSFLPFLFFLRSPFSIPSNSLVPSLYPLPSPLHDFLCMDSSQLPFWTLKKLCSKLLCISSSAFHYLIKISLPNCQSVPFILFSPLLNLPSTSLSFILSRILVRREGSD